MSRIQMARKYMYIAQLPPVRGALHANIEVLDRSANNMVAAKRKATPQRRAAIVRAVRKRRKKVREMAIHHKGGRCQCCGYDKCKDSLEFHHLVRDKKSFGISAKGYTRSWRAIEEELEKCIMLCANCHREWHSGLIDEKDLSFFNNCSIPV